MKSIINKIIYSLSLGVIGMMLVLVTFLTLLRLSTPYFETRRSDIEKFATQLIQHPVSVRGITITNSGLEPVVKLSDVSVFNKEKTKVLLQAQELQIGIDLIGSLFSWSIKPGLIGVSGINFAIYQEKNGGFNVSSIKGALGGDANFTFVELLKWFFEQSQISFNRVALTWHLATGELLQFADLRLKLNNGILQHELEVNGKFMQQGLPVKFSANLRMRGDALKQTISSLTGKIIIEGGKFEWPQKISDKNALIPIPEVCSIDLLIENSQVASNLLRAPLSIDSLAGKVTWENNKNNLDIHVNNFKYQDRWLTMHGNMQFLFQTGIQSPIVDMQLTFRLIDLAKAKLYYPVTELPPKAAVWLDQAFISSKPMFGHMILQGPIDKFPFDHNEGSFLVNADIKDVHLNYDDLWPPIVDINGKMIFSNRSMKILAHSAKIMQTPVGSIQAIIPDLDLPILSIDSSIQTDSSVGMRFITASPLKKTIASKLRLVHLTGQMQLALKMLIPLTLLVPQQDTKVDGSIILKNNHMRLNDLNFSLDDIHGKLHFTKDNLTADVLSGKLFDKPVQLTVNTLNNIATQVTLAGRATVGDIEHGFAIKLKPYVAGDFRYQALLELYDVKHENIFKLDSDLQGIGIDLPPPFAKTIADSKSKFNLTYYFGDNKPSHIMINYNDQISAALTKKGGEIKFGSTLANVLDTSGIVVFGEIKKFDWEVWRKYLYQMQKNFSGSGMVISEVDLDINELDAFDRVFKEVVLKAKPKKDSWEIMLATPTMHGKIFFPNTVGALIKGEFQKFCFDSSDNKHELLIKPQDIPPLHFIADNFQYGNKKFDQVEFITHKQPKGAALNKVVISDPYFYLTASGDWMNVNNKQQTVLRGKVRSADVGGWFKQLGLTNDLIGGKGEANFALKWSDAPYKPTLKNIDGSFAISINKGQIINLSGKTEIKLGLSRILNILSLRRLSLDLGDLTKKGFLFDKLEGTFEIINGNVLVKEVKLDGPTAGVRAKGRIGLIAQDYSIDMTVIPHVTSSIPVAASFVGGPLVGVVSWVVTDVIVAPVMKKVTSHTYRITGSWDNPVIQKM